MKKAADKSSLLSRSTGLMGGELSIGGASAAGSSGGLSLGASEVAVVASLGFLDVREGAPWVSQTKPSEASNDK
jgi:hypothetical protein